MVLVVVETKSKTVTRTGLNAIWAFPRLNPESAPERVESVTRKRVMQAGDSLFWYDWSENGTFAAPM